MEKLTALFLQQLSDATQFSKEILDLARENMANVVENCFEQELSEQTLYCSTKGKNCRSRIDQLLQYACNITAPKEAIKCINEMKTLRSRCDSLHSQTQLEIVREGHLDSSKLHIFYYKEQEYATNAIDEMIRIDMFRILALGGVKFFTKIPIVRKVSRSLPDRVNFYRDNILPALQAISDKQLYGYWAIQFRANCRVGPSVNLPAFVVCGPVKGVNNLLPGESRCIETSTGQVFEGLGLITNITPATIYEAQEKIQTNVSIDRMDAIGKISPRIFLDQYFSGSLYAISPYELFSLQTVREMNRTILRRIQLHQCYYCGSIIDRGVPVCRKCFKKVQVS